MSHNKKKVLLLPTYFPTKSNKILGSQIFEQTLLLSKDFDFHVFYCMPGISLKRFIWYRFLKLFFNINKHKSCVSEIYSDKLKVSGVYYFQSKFLSYNLNFKIRKISYNYLYKNLIENNWHPDLVHARTAEFTGVDAAEICKKYKLPFLLTENCSLLLDDTFSMEKLKAYKFAIESADTLTVVSNYLKAFLLTNNIKCKPIVTGNWIDEEKFFLNPQKKSNNLFTIITVGYAAFIKDWPTLFKAIQLIIFNYNIQDIEVIFCVTQTYDDQTRNYFKNNLKKYNLESYCKVYDQVPRDKIVELYQKSDLFVSTSISETFGIACAEAMCCGLPVVATNNGGINDIINSQNGIKIQIGDYKELAKAIISIKNDLIIFDPMEIRKSIIEKFGTERFKQQMKEIYNNTTKRL